MKKVRAIEVKEIIYEGSVTTRAIYGSEMLEWWTGGEYIGEEKPGCV